ncbi:MAG TPA: prolyl oligopeptidase family serine peptidase [Armatimonadota bacterium]|jgi:poly(3-hydroxybutyrate) depolymerase
MYLLCLFLLLATGITAGAAEWPPVLDTVNPSIQALDGRKVEFYTHGCRDTWGYADAASDAWKAPAPLESGKNAQVRNSFYVLSPSQPKEQSPLVVVLHSANRTAFDYLGTQVLHRKLDNVDPTDCVLQTPEGYYGLYLNSPNEEWWGWAQAKHDPARYASANTPGEQRVLDSIEWVVQRYHIDRNRIYLTGLSMGGCGTLGIGMAHGEIFAAMCAFVPAGTEYMALRRGWPADPAVTATPEERAAWLQHISGAGRPDPPYLVDFSATDDNWSKTQPALLHAARAGHLPLVLAWGPFHHTTYRGPINKIPICATALAFPWLEIRKDAAYPVFTNATCDQRAPWRDNPETIDPAGQMNACFRWKNLQDTPTRLKMQLWLTPDQPTATADITLRRLQHFQVKPGQTYAWTVTQDGKQLAAGTVTPDAANLLTLPQVPITTAPVELTLRKK